MEITPNNLMNDYVDSSGIEENQPVALFITRRIRPHKRTDYEAFVKATIEAAGQFEGYLGTSVFRPRAQQDGEYRLILRFDRISHLRQWERSSVRRQWLNKLEALAEEPPEIKLVSGLDTWFDCLGQQAVSAPARYKMAVLVWLAIYPLISLLLILFGPWLDSLPLLLRTLVLTLIAVPIMTWFIMPWLHQLFSNWLHPAQAER